MQSISFIVITAACFAAAVLNLAIESRFKKRFMGVAAAAAGCLGIIIYGYGFSWCYGASPTALLRALFAVCRMFSGSNDLSLIESAPLLNSSAAIVVFWAAHFLAFYVTASTAITAVGNRLLRRIRVTLLRRGTLLLVYGTNENSVKYGCLQAQNRRRSVMFVDLSCDAALEAAINAAGAVMEKGADALHPNAGFLRRIGMKPGKRKLEIAAMHADCFKNLAYAQMLLDALDKAGIHPEQTSLILQGIDESRAASLLSRDGSRGYGSVLAFDAYDLSARLMVQQLPPCNTLRFDENAKAVQDFSALIVGFGRMGRAALEQLVMNGQFCGSSFRVDIFDVSPQNGFLHAHELLNHYDIRFHAANGKSSAFYDFIDQNACALRYIVLCTGNAKENEEIALDLERWFRNRDAKPVIVQCSKNGPVWFDETQNRLCSRDIYNSEAMDLERIDAMAMAINHVYSRNSGLSARQNWQRCDYFSRMSSRASADFYPAILRASASTQDQVWAGKWPPPEPALENLSITEHLRWCAFHYVMGFSPMSPGEYERRAAQYQKEIRENGKASLRIGKDMHLRRHACLIDWNDLDALSARENAITGASVDYKEMDRNNIRALPEILKALREISGENEGGKSA